MGRTSSAPSFPARTSFLRIALAAALLAIFSLPAAAQDRDDEIVATLAGGRVIVHATRENIVFIAINEPVSYTHLTLPTILLV